MAEKVLLRFEGGPLDGQSVLAEEDWPPGDMVEGEGKAFAASPPGRYVKVSQSALLGEVSPPGIIRGALYRWEVIN